MKCDAGQDGQFVCRIPSTHFRRQIVHPTLMHDQRRRILISPSAVFHMGEDIIAGSTQDAVEPLDAVGDKAASQSGDDRNTSGNSSFEGDAHPMLGSKREEGVTVEGQHILVVGDDMFAGFEAGLASVGCLSDTIQYVNNNPHIGVRENGIQLVANASRT